MIYYNPKLEPMNMNSEIEEVFLKRMKNMRKEELTNMLRCTICSGLFRFAHTIVDCGHTFCQVCIFNYIRGFKGRNPSIKCPQCHIPVEPFYKRSIIRDIFKQTLVDSLAPEFSTQDQVIARRVQQLFPQFDLEFLFEQFKFVSLEMATKINKKDSQSNIFARLAEKIKEKFNIKFEVFCQMIVNEENFNNFLNIIKSTSSESKIIEIKPKTERDFSFIGINNQMKASTLNVTKLQRFIEKKALQKINKTQQVPAQWLSTYDDKLDIKLYLTIDGKQIEPDDNLEELLRIHRGAPILYSLSK